MNEITNDTEAKAINALGKMLEYSLTSPNVLDTNLETANIVDALCSMKTAVNRLAESIENYNKGIKQ